MNKSNFKPEVSNGKGGAKGGAAAGKERKPYACSVCGGAGHNAATCDKKSSASATSADSHLPEALNGLPKAEAEILAGLSPDAPTQFHELTTADADADDSESVVGEEDGIDPVAVQIEQEEAELRAREAKKAEAAAQTEREEAVLEQLATLRVEEKKEEGKIVPAFTRHNRGHNKSVLNFGEQRVPEMELRDLFLQYATEVREANSENEELSKELARLMDEYSLPCIKRRVVLSDDLLSLKGGTEKKEKKKKKGSRLMTLLKNRDYHTGNSKLDDLEQFLQWAEENCMDLDEWRREKSASELQVNYEAEFKSFDSNTPTEALVDKVKQHARALSTVNSEAGKRAALLGRAAHLLRKRDSGMTWIEVADSIGEGLSEKSFANYEKYYLFVNKYPRFLRVKTTYCSLLKYSTALTKYFKTNSAAAAEWEDLEAY